MNKLEKLVSNNIQVKTSIDRAFLKNLSLTDDDAVKEEPYRKSAIAYICVSTTARAIAQVPLVVQRKIGKTWEVVEEHPIHELIHRPNAQMNKYILIEYIVGHLLLDGNVWIYPSPSMKNPTNLWILRKDFMTPVKNDNGQLVAWKYHPKGEDGKPVSKDALIIPPNEIGHIKFWNPNDIIMGQKPLEAGKLSLESDYKSSRFNEQFFEKGASPSGVLSTDNRLNDKTFKRLEKQIKDKYQGYKKSHAMMVLEAGLKYTPMGLSQKDMDFVNLKKYARDEILQIFGMKKAVISITDDLNYSTAREQKREWWNGTNIPIMRLIEDSISSLFFKKQKKERIIFDTTKVPALQEEYKEKIENFKTLWDAGYPANVLNRSLQLDLPEIDGGDIGYVPMNYVPLNQAGTESNFFNDNSGGEEGEEGEEDDEESEKSFLFNKKSDSQRQDKLKKIWQNFVNKTSRMEKGFKGKISKVFYELRKETLQALNKEKDFSDVDNVDFEKYAILLSDYSKPYYLNAVKEGFLGFVTETGIDISFNLDDPVINEFLLAKPTKIGSVVDKTLRNRVIQQVREGASNGESIQQVEDRIKAVFNTAANRAKTIARTEIVGSANFGRHAALLGSGFEKKEWFTALDEKVRDQHIKMQGEVILSKDNWVLPDGTTLAYPGDWNGPASQTINCRCIEVAFVGEEDEPEL